MSKQRWFIDQKKQHVTAWRASGLTRQQYCELNDIPFNSFREWPQDVAKAGRRSSEPTVLPVHIVEPVPPAESFSTMVNEPVTLFLPGGIRMCCHPSQLTDVFRALKHADA
ncbi:IS66 family insertion sequence element accessory protein TnpB [Salmonella enterica]|uniref:IS66 family insertion sequence element accessory protein TnpB n=1 Tax=Salmonella enterica TaxID=28901 RepID=A0A5U7RSC5_SALER|nr:IS66 family insertion sequence element accessory protein TnpB [Salmonella enterica]EHW6438929.1 IS66 family insertion sequence element accessory protein TnpB [Salmonella enterica]